MTLTERIEALEQQLAAQQLAIKLITEPPAPQPQLRLIQGGKK